MPAHPVSEEEVARVLADLRARVRGTATPASSEMTPLQRAIAQVNANWHLSSRLLAPENAPRRLYILNFMRRGVRRLMVGLLNTIVDQQNGFNAAATRALTELAKENAELKSRIGEIEGRGIQIERQQK